jgi:hypothetical protein
MKLNSQSKVVLALLAIAGAMLLGLAGSSDEAVASNMGFKENKQIFRQLPAAIQYGNLVALPFNNPYLTSQDICDALNLSVGDATCQIQQINAGTGVTATDTCGGGGSFPLAARVGVSVVQCTVNHSGIIVGSHAPGVGVTLSLQAVTPPEKGTNNFPIPFHTTNATSQNVCDDLGLVAPVSIRRNQADIAVPLIDTCGGGGAFNLVLGESLIIKNLAATISPIPSHF